VNGVSFYLKYTNATRCAVAILRENVDPDVRNWEVLGERNEDSVGVDTDNWVRWRSGEVRLNPGHQYAVRVRGIAGTGSYTFTPYKLDKGGWSYQGGRAYNSAGVAQNFDLNYTVFADNDGTRVTVTKRTPGVGGTGIDNFRDRWGQTFVARGKGLAGADVWADGNNNHWDLKFEWIVRAGGPTGPEIAPRKITPGAFFSHGTGLHGVSYNPGEAPLTPGGLYFIEFRVNDSPPDSPGFDPHITDDPYCDDYFQDCDCSVGPLNPDYCIDPTAYKWNGSSYVAYNQDLAMTIIEYESDTIPPDSDADGDVDMEDFGRFQACYSSGAGLPPIPECDWADFNSDDTVDLEDFSILQVCMSGADMPADPACYTP
jgi:hypothetical protein